MMPFEEYHQMADEDVNAIIAYLRTLEPVGKQWPVFEPPFPLSLIFRIVPEPYEPVEKPSRSDGLEYGKYMTTIALCGVCHTPGVDGDPGRPIPEMRYAGGLPTKLPTGGKVYSANLTPDEETGIGSWNEERFVQRFKQYLEAGDAKKIDDGNFNTLMPWRLYAQMDEEDLKAIYAYLRSLDPIKNQVIKFVADK